MVTKEAKMIVTGVVINNRIERIRQLIPDANAQVREVLKKFSVNCTGI